MATNVFRGGAPAVAKVVTVTPANVEIGDVFNLILTMDDATTVTVTFTATATTVANVTAGLVAAWNASGASEVQRITAADATTALTLTADTSGVPFALTTSTTDGGGANTQTLTAVVTTASSGPNDVNVAGNWSLGTVPAAGEDVEIGAAAPAVLYSLGTLSGTALGSFCRRTGHSAAVGRYEDGRLYYLQIDPGATRCEIYGSGSLCAIDIGSRALSPIINHSGASAGSGWHAVYLKGSALATPQIMAGDVAIGGGPNGTPGGTATVTAGFSVEGGSLTVYRGATVAGTTARVADGATLTAWVSIPTVVVNPGGTFTQSAGNWTTLTAHDGATVNADAGGTYATTNLVDAAVLDAARTFVAKTFSTVNEYSRNADRRYIESLVTWTTLNRTYAMAS